MGIKGGGRLTASFCPIIAGTRNISANAAWKRGGSPEGLGPQLFQDLCFFDAVETGEMFLQVRIADIGDGVLIGAGTLRSALSVI